MAKRFTATIEKRGRWYVGYVDGLPGVNTQGRTLKEVSDNLREAITLVLEAQQGLRAKEPPTKVYKKTIVVEA
ncbi:MAG: type II toxin-antitoxin system HicB family antitoxin [Chloroflexi bacterium]|nr:type II toxin-antitoxin system HicB family antitoxin [Chloroflexota bacterium]